jgi:hypothetical protein
MSDTLDTEPREGRFDGDYVHMSVPVMGGFGYTEPIGWRRITVRFEGTKAVEVLPAADAK